MGEVLLTSIDGAEVPPGEATISILDDGLLRGDGAFEVIKAYGGELFRLDQHLDRLEASAGTIELEVDRPSLEREIEAVMARAGGSDRGLRIVVTRGGRRILMLEKLGEWPPSASVALITYTPNEILGGVKSISYAANMQSSRIAAARGADEPVWVHPDGIVLEAPTSSIFWADADGTIYTPALDCRILDSITRKVVVNQLPVEEGSFDQAQLEGAHEAFLASTTREIQAISSIDGIELMACPGPATERAIEAFGAAVAAEVWPGSTAGETTGG